MAGAGVWALSGGIVRNLNIVVSYYLLEVLLMVILDDGYFVPADDWLRVRRRLLAAVKGDDVPKGERLYVDKDDVGILPRWVVLYKDGNGGFFVKRSDIVKWKGFKKFRGIFSRG